MVTAKSSSPFNNELFRLLRPYCIPMASLSLMLLLLLAASGETWDPEETIDVQILAINDFHGQIEPPSGNLTVYYGSNCVPVREEVGGLEYLASHVRQRESTNPNTILVSAGDSIGASPLISALFHDEPTIEALSALGLDYSAVGNHEFDEGAEELERMQYGCCHSRDGCLDGDRFTGAGFSYLAANIVNETTGATLFPPYGIRRVQGVPVGFIGVTLEEAPSIISPAGIRGLKFLDEAESINRYVSELKAQGVQTIIVLIHNGGYQSGLPDEGVNLTGPISEIVNRTDEEVDVFITGHTHAAYNSIIDGRIVTEAGSQGKVLTDIDLEISRETGDVIEARAKNVPVTHDVPQDPEAAEIVQKYRALSDPPAGRVVGSITSDITRAADLSSGESALGDVVADSQLNATTSNGAVAAFLNPGGIRADMIFSKADGSERPGEVTYKEAYSVQPFSNCLVTMNLTGAQIDRLLEQQFDNPGHGETRILQVSEGFTYTWNASAPVGSRIDIALIKVNGTCIDPDGLYRVTANNFLADGGDKFTVFSEGTDRVGGITDLDALVAYLETSSPLSPGSVDRIEAVS